MPNDQKVTRKLRAILSADVKGYSLLMADDEVHTIQTLKAYRQIMSDLIQNHSGRVVDNPGDNLLAEFGSAVDAVECAVQVQNKLKKENARYVEDNRLEFRIGINIGDVVQDGDRIYGSGVNVAARIEGIADAGRICVSRNTYDQVQDKLDYGFKYLGEHEVKNIKEPVRVYSVLIDANTDIPFLEDKLELPDKPSIAVLPFDNMSRNNEDEYIADGISESIISALSKSRGLLVIARNSTFVYKGKAVKIQHIAEELGVRYVLEGSLLKSGTRLRIIVQLIDALSGHHIWSEQYDRELNDFFDLLDEITKRIVIELQVEITEGDGTRIYQKETHNFKAWGYYVKAWQHFFYHNKAGFLKAEYFLNQSLEADPDNSTALALLSIVHIQKIGTGNSDNIEEDFKKAVDLLNKCISSESHFPQIAWALYYLICREYDKSIMAAENAISLCPNDPYGHLALAQTKYYLGEYDNALSLLLTAKRLTPYPTSNVLALLGFTYREIGEYDKALVIFNELYKRAKNNEFELFLSHNYLASANAMIGNLEEARFHAGELLKLRPNYSLDFNRNTTFHKDPSSQEHILIALRKAGIPEHSPE